MPMKLCLGGSVSKTIPYSRALGVKMQRFGMMLVRAVGEPLQSPRCLYVMYHRRFSETWSTLHIRRVELYKL